MVFKVRGILDFSPEDKTKKHANQASWKQVAMIRTNCELDRYYAWFLKKRFNLELNSNLRGTHVTFINDRMDAKTFNQFSELFDGKEIDFYIETEPRSNGEHWWLRVHCPEAESIREIMGLSREPFFGMHLTLGRAEERYPEGVEGNNNNSIMKIKKDYIEHSKYILECCKLHNLTSSDVRKPLNQHEIVECNK
jgi:hypothetical protein